MTDKTTNLAKYSVLMGPMRTEYCVLGFITNYPDGFKLKKGQSVSKDWPSNVQFTMDPDFKKRIRLSDNLVNGEDLIIASPQLQEFLKGQKVPDIEFLPIHIINHKKRVESKDYSIVNLLSVQDCLDKNRSDLTWNKIDPEKVSIIKKLALDESKIEKKAQLFRMKHVSTATLCRQDLAEKLTQAGFTGLKFLDPVKYQS